MYDLATPPPSAIASEPWPADVPIAVYLPADLWPTGDLPPGPDGQYWDWLQEQPPSFNRGVYDFTLQTALYLRTVGVPCDLVCHMPAEGIVLTHPPGFPEDGRPSRYQYWVSIKGDKAKHRWAQMHEVQNPCDDLFERSQGLWPTFAAPFWVQPGLVPRATDRGDRFEVAAFFGRERELAPEFKDARWAERLAEIGLTWKVVPPQEWNDYRQVDVAIAARNFGKATGFNWKPPSKLINAWHGGVPAVLGREDSFRSMRRSPLDYLEVRSADETFAALARLRDDPELRRAMAANARDRAAEVNSTTIALRWRRALLEVAVPGYRRWRRWPRWRQRLFFAQRSGSEWLARQQSTLRRWRGHVTGPVKALLGR